MKSRSFVSVILTLVAVLSVPENASSSSGGPCVLHFDGVGIGSTDEIPRNYKTWSLFLICAPGWISQNGDTGIRDLYTKFLAFGDAIGTENVAIWFWKQATGPRTAENTNLGRSAKYCHKYKMLPSDSPQILVTTHYPDDPGLGNYFVVKLNGLDAADSASALDKLTDEITTTGLTQKPIDEPEFWHKILTGSIAALSSAGCYFKKVSISLHTGVLNANIGHSGKASC